LPPTDLSSPCEQPAQSEVEGRLCEAIIRTLGAHPGMNTL